MYTRNLRQTLAVSGYYIETKSGFNEICTCCYFELYKSKNNYHLKTVSKSIRPHNNSQTINVDEIYYNQFEEAIRALEFNCNFVANACKLQDITIPNSNDVTPKTFKNFEYSFFKNLDGLKRLKANPFIFNVASADGCAITTSSLTSCSSSIDLQAKHILQKAKECVKNYNAFNPAAVQPFIEDFEQYYANLLERKQKAFEQADELIEQLQNKEISLINLYKTLSCQSIYPSIRAILERKITHSL